MVYHLDEKEFSEALAKEDKKWILDVRSNEEFSRNHLKGAINIDIMSHLAVDEIVKLQQDRPCFVYCHVGVRSKSACKLLTTFGFEEIYHLRKGIQHWKGELVDSED
jgi:rhodanese-related sulfurtransferase